MADKLAAAADLTTLLGYSVDTAKAELLIEGATAVIQAVTQQRIVEVVGDVARLDLDEYDGGPYLHLPELPVTAVTSASVGASAVTDFTAQLSRGRLWRAYGWRSLLVRYPTQPSEVTVTYTHGYPAGHQRLQLARSACLALIRGAYGNPTGATQVKIDDFAAMYEAMSSQLEPSSFLATALRRQYHRPPASVRLVTAQR